MLRMPAKFSYMTEEEAEYGGGCWEWVLTIFGGACLLGGGACFAVHFIWDIGDRKTMIIAGAVLCAVGAVCLGFGIKGLCDSFYEPIEDITNNSASFEDQYPQN